MVENAGEPSPTREQLETRVNELEQGIKDREQRIHDLKQENLKHNEDYHTYWDLKNRAYDLSHFFPDKAVECYRQACDIAPHPEAKMDCNRNIAILCGKNGDYQPLVEYAKQLKDSGQDDEEITMLLDIYIGELAAQ